MFVNMLHILWLQIQHSFIIFLFAMFFTLVLTRDFSLESKWQQDFSDLQNFS